MGFQICSYGDDGYVALLEFARGFLFLCVFSGCGSNYVLYRRISAPSRLEALGLTYLGPT